MFNQALTIFQETGNLREQVWVLNNIGTLYFTITQYNEAIDAYQRAILASKLAGVLVREGWVWRNLGGTYRAMSQYDKAIEAFLEAIKVFQATGSTEDQLETVHLLQEVQQEFS